MGDDNFVGYDLLSLVEQDVPALAGTFNGRYTREVPCPKCGGRTRFRLRLSRDGKYRAFCSHCAPRGLDAVQYIMWRDGVDYGAARRFWEESGGSIIRLSLPGFLAGGPPADRAPSEVWQKRARAFVESCAAMLWTERGRAALEYLRGRGLSDDTIRRYKLGYNHARRVGDPKEWGLSINKQVVAVPGITIPREILGELWAVNVRRIDRAPGHKYICLTGSVLGLWGADDIAFGKPVITFGGEFDAMLAAQHAPTGLACVTFGGEGHKVNEPWATMLAKASQVYVCLDNDAAGDRGVGAWLLLPRAVRVRVPQGKDLTDFAKAGGDVAGWLRSVVEQKADGDHSNFDALLERMLRRLGYQLQRVGEDRIVCLLSWMPPNDPGRRVDEARRWLAIFDDHARSDDERAQAYARYMACIGDRLTADGQQWIHLAQC